MKIAIMNEYAVNEKKVPKIIPVIKNEACVSASSSVLEYPGREGITPYSSNKNYSEWTTSIWIDKIIETNNIRLVKVLYG